MTKPSVSQTDQVEGISVSGGDALARCTWYVQKICASSVQDSGSKQHQQPASVNTQGPNWLEVWTKSSPHTPVAASCRSVNRHRLPCPVALLRCGRLQASRIVAAAGFISSARGSSTPDRTNRRHFGGGSCRAAASLAGDVLDCTSVVGGC